MRLLEKLPKISRSHSSGLLAATVLVSSILQFIPAALAVGTAAGTTIDNTALGTYTDSAGTPQAPVVSNLVTAQVAEVAGITVTSAGVTPAVAGPVTAGSVLYYDYLITNTGNDTTRFTIPNIATVTSGFAAVTGNLKVDLTNSGTFTDITGAAFTTPDTAAGLIPANGSIKVRVPVTVSAGATAGQQLYVKLGNTPSEAQNQARTGATVQSEDVFTVDGTVSPDAVGSPINGTREASATQFVTVGTALQSFAAILKGSSYSDSGTPTVIDDKITYSLSLRVDSAAPFGSTGFSPAALAGTNITVTGLGTVSRVLVSDAIPANTVLAATPVAPSGWTVIYTTDSTTTVPNSSAATWTTTAPSLNTVTRVGFINNGPVSPGTTTAGFSFQVVTSGLTAAGASVANIAQVFGTSQGASGTTLVYDESGDQNPSNFTDGPNPVPTTFNPSTNTGVANAATDGTDPGNNTGTGPNGEANVVSVTPSTGVLAGPQGAPGAVGPTSNNDDFTNKAAQPVGNNPNAVGFTNTVQNTGGSPVAITLTAVNAPLPNGTTVTITYGASSTTYTYTGGVPTASGADVIIPASDLPSGGSVNYAVAVDLPAGTTPLAGYPAAVTAFVDQGTLGLDAGDTARNTSIDRVYFGYMSLSKTGKIFAADGTTVLVAAGTALTGNIPPGSIIEYVITYKNITEAQVGSGTNVILNAENIIITENGTLGGLNGNNWALDNDANSSIDTSNVVGSAIDPGVGSTITFFNGATGATAGVDQAGTTQTTDVTKYVDNIIGPLGPGVSRTFTFRRTIN
jgi:hypothetical protein